MKDFRPQQHSLDLGNGPLPSPSTFGSGQTQRWDMSCPGLVVLSRWSLCPHSSTWKIPNFCRGDPKQRHCRPRCVAEQHSLFLLCPSSAFHAAKSVGIKHLGKMQSAGRGCSNQGLILLSYRNEKSMLQAAATQSQPMARCFIQPPLGSCRARS